MMDVLIYKKIFFSGLPIWILLAGGLIVLLVDAFIKNNREIVFYLGLISFAVSIAFVFKRWVTSDFVPVDFLTFDRLSYFFILLVMLTGFLSLLNSHGYLKSGINDDDEVILTTMPAAFVSLIIFCVVGQIFLFASDHLIVNFIGLECLSLGTYALVGSRRQDARSNEAAIKYYVTGSLASAVILYGIVLLYASYGTLRLDELAQIKSASSLGPVFPRVAMSLILVGFFFKVSLVPFHFWTPDVYEGAPTPVTGFMTSAVKIASFAFLIRLLNSIHFFGDQKLVSILAFLAGLTMVIGNLGALVQDNLKRMLAYSSIAHAGYILLGMVACYEGSVFDVSLAMPVLFYLLTYLFSVLGAFGVLSVMIWDKKEACQLSDLTGMGYTRPVLSFVFCVFLFSLLGFPPTAGFLGKYSLFSLAIQKGYLGLAILGMVTSVISAAYYIRPLVYLYFKGEPGRAPITLVTFPAMFALVFCFLMVLYLGLIPTTYLKMAFVALGILS